MTDTLMDIHSTECKEGGDVCVSFGFDEPVQFSRPIKLTIEV